MRERKRTRLSGFDYSKDNLYFVTSCVYDRICCFGEIINDGMALNELGNIAHDQFIWLNNQYNYVNLHAFVVMPNHVHAIIEINRNLVKSENNGLENDPSVGIFRVGAGRDLPLRQPNTEQLPLQPFTESRPLKIKSLSQLIGAYKTTVSKQIHQIGNVDFKWQRSFHDHIIRNDYSFDNILNYIHDNLKNWNGEKLDQILR